MEYNVRRKMDGDGRTNGTMKKSYDEIDETNTQETPVTDGILPQENAMEEGAQMEVYFEADDQPQMTDEAPSEAESASQEMAEQPAPAKEPYPNSPEGGQVRRMRSGPQIYGQNGSMPQGQMYSQQGMIRRDIQGRSSSAPQGAMGYQGQPQGAAGYQGQPMQGRPMTDAQGRPVNGPQQMRQMRPGQPMQGRPMMQSPVQKARQMAGASRKMLASPLFLIIALCHTVYLVGSIAAIFMSQLNYSQFARLIQSLSLPQQVSGYASSAVSILSKLDAGMIGVNLALRIPDLLFCLGLWMVFITAAAAKSKDHMSGIGFGFMKADIIINMIVSCVVMLFVLIVMVATVVAAWVSENTVMIAITVALLVVTIVIVMMVIMYYFSYLATLTTCRVNSDAGESYGKVSTYVAVLHIILALFSIVSLLSGIVNNEVAGIASAAGRILWMVLFAVWLLMYKGKLEEYEV
jgi:hypothetical protein